MQDEDTVSELRAQVQQARERFETLVRLQEQYPERDWLDTAIDRAAATRSEAEQALKVALEKPPAPAPPPPPPPPPHEGPPAAPPTPPSTDGQVRPRKTRNVNNPEWRKKMRDTDRDVARGVSRAVALGKHGYGAPTDRQLRRWEKDWASPGGRARADSDISDI